MHDNPFPSSASFIPDDVIAKRLERRTSAICLTLFFIVMIGVAGAFFVTNQRWTQVKAHQDAINTRYVQAAKDIEILKVLESQRAEMVEKASLTTALIEHVPRSILLAEFINRMPEETTLLEFTLESKRIKEQAPVAKEAKGKKPRSLTRSPSAEEAKELAEASKPRPPKFETSLVIIGAASTHQDVSEYLKALQECELLGDVELKYSESTIIDDQDLVKFRLEADLLADADARRIEPLKAPRLNVIGEGPRGVLDAVADALKGGKEH
ncbi:MAG: PilN domain-containing protein [Phycisphaeraceae bacterium]|nr:PilN domain-containing protein [Phycisphaeraceae bacterium]MCB9847950.1 PilN domain-containing protein [Phycisphaeraceae bacterium]